MTFVAVVDNTSSLSAAYVPLLEGMGLGLSLGLHRGLWFCWMIVVMIVFVHASAPVRLLVQRHHLGCLNIPVLLVEQLHML
jgi:hypothetical protein